MKLIEERLKSLEERRGESSEAWMKRKNKMNENLPLCPRNEGRRLFELCLKHGAKPGQVHKWLKETLESVESLKKQMADQEAVRNWWR